MRRGARERTMLTVKEVALRLSVDRKTVYSAIERGEIPAIRLGRRGIIRVARLVTESIEQGRGVPPGGLHGGST